MDKLKPILASLKKHHFWIVCAMVVLVGLVIWSIASSALAKKYQERETKLKGLNDGVGKVASAADPPNDKVIAKAQESKARQGVEVYNAWFLRFKEQKANNQIPPELGDDFKIEFDSLPSQFESEEQLSIYLRERYMTFVRDHLWKLLQVVDVRYPMTQRRPGEPAPQLNDLQMYTEMLLRGTSPASSMGSGMGSSGMGSGEMPGMMSGMTPGMSPGGIPMGVGSGAGGTAPIQMGGRVQWDEADIKRMFSRFIFQGSAPSTLRVRVGIEDLWVYRALLQLISQTNGKVRLDLPVARIETIQIGRDAARMFLGAENRILPAAAGGAVMGSEGMASGSMPSMPGGPGMMPGMPSMPGMPGSTGPEGMASGGGAAGEQAELLGYRYVDDKGKPLPDAKHPFPQYKMMPVYMKLWVNQLNIPELLARCPGLAMPVEVQRVSFRPGEGFKANLGPLGGGVSSGSGEMMPGGMTPGGMMPGGMTPGMSGSEGSSGGYGSGGDSYGTRTAIASDEPHVAIEVFGIIQIFLPPDLKALALDPAASVGVPAAAGSTPADSAVSPAPVAPAAGAPAPEPTAVAPPTAAPPGATPVAPASPVPSPATPAPAAPAAAVPSPAAAPGASGAAAPGAVAPAPAPATPATPAAPAAAPGTGT